MIQSVSLTELLDGLEPGELAHREVLDTGPVTLELARYPPEESPPTLRHAEDEIYYVVSGSGTLRVEDSTVPVEAGELIHVEPATEHDFVEITEELTLLVIFGPSVNPSSYARRGESEI